VTPPAEHVHWLFASALLFVGLLLAAEAIVGREVWRRRRWRAYLFPSLVFATGVLLWPVMVFYTNSAIHMLAHGVWAQTVMFAGAAQLGLAAGKLRDRRWELALPAALFVSGLAFLVHEQNGWLFSRAAFLHHALGWTLVVGALLPLGRCLRPRSVVLAGGFAVLVLAVSVLLYADRDTAPIFGHLDPLAGVPRR
jgi:hypothetical protein